MNINMDIINQQFEELINPYGKLSDLGTSNNDFSVENTSSFQWQLQQDNTRDLGHNLVCTSVSDCANESKRQKLMHESPYKTKKNLGKGKRRTEKKEEKPNEVVHVRARRGQATDGHSLAERVRRERVDNKLRYLKELVPGCHKGMGMTVMLDEIINYICSLQHQVEFLYKELAVASSSYMNLEKNTTKKVQGTPGTASHEILKERETCMFDEQTIWSTDMCNSAWPAPFNSNFSS